MSEENLIQFELYAFENVRRAMIRAVDKLDSILDDESTGLFYTSVDIESYSLQLGRNVENYCDKLLSKAVYAKDYVDKKKASQARKTRIRSDLYINDFSFQPHERLLIPNQQELFE